MLLFGVSGAGGQGHVDAFFFFVLFHVFEPGPPSFQKHPYANPATTFYKRDLPSNCVSFGGPEGKQLFREALDAGTMECYFGLAEQFRTQSEPAFCGLGSLVMSLNALGTDPMRVWKGPWRWIDEEMLDCCSPLEVISQKGVTMSEFSCLAACNGANCVTKYASKHSEEEFRKDVMQTTVESSGVVLVVSYDRSSLGQTGTGHFSPIGGFLESRNRVLVLDVARFKYPPHWLDLSELYRAMLPPDEVTGKSRGWHLLTRRKQQLSFLHFPGHISGRLWYEFVERVKCIMDKDNLLNTLVELAQDEKFAPVFPTLVPVRLFGLYMGVFCSLVFLFSGSRGRAMAHYGAGEESWCNGSLAFRDARVAQSCCRTSARGAGGSRPRRGVAKRQALSGRARGRPQSHQFVNIVLRELQLRKKTHSRVKHNKYFN
jgi:hypothetical protein